MDAAASELAQLTNADPVNAELVMEEGQPALKEGTTGRQLDAAATKEAIAGSYLDATEV